MKHGAREKKKSGKHSRLRRQLACACWAQFAFLFSVINMRTNRLFCFKKAAKQAGNEAAKVVETQEMGSQLSVKSRQRSNSQNDANLEMAKYRCPRTKKITSAKPEAVVLKRRRSYSECDNLANERQILCKKLKVNQLYTDYCGRNSFMAAFFRLLGKFAISNETQHLFIAFLTHTYTIKESCCFWLFQPKLILTLKNYKIEQIFLRQ